MWNIPLSFLYHLLLHHRDKPPVSLRYYYRRTLFYLIERQGGPDRMVIRQGGRVNSAVPKIIAARNDVIYGDISRLIRGGGRRSVWPDASRTNTFHYGPLSYSRKKWKTRPKPLANNIKNYIIQNHGSGLWHLSGRTANGYFRFKMFGRGGNAFRSDSLEIWSDVE